jgi:hypothetical protein
VQQRAEGSTEYQMSGHWGRRLDEANRQLHKLVHGPSGHVRVFDRQYLAHLSSRPDLHIDQKYISRIFEIATLTEQRHKRDHSI